MLLQSEYSLAACTTLGVGGAASHFVVVDSLSTLTAAVDFAASHALPLAVLGGGSNLWVPDAGVTAVVLHMALRGVTYDEQSDGTVLVTAAAGEVLDELIAATVERGLWGLENLSAIPGTVGAAPVQNVGAYGVEVGDLIESVSVYDVHTRTLSTVSRPECAFAYRDSRFKQAAHAGDIITAVTFRLSTQGQPQTSYADVARAFPDPAVVPSQAAVRAAIVAIRAAKFPDWTQIGTAGSFFKNPVVSHDVATRLQSVHPNLPVYPVSATQSKVSLGFILDKVCHLKGVSHGSVGLYAAQALVLVAARGATAADVDAFATWVATQVYDACGVSIEREVRDIRDCLVTIKNIS